MCAGINVCVPLCEKVFKGKVLYQNLVVVTFLISDFM